ncbi:MAG: hypothetical protein AABW49_00865 [Nanoarchaeota archaeon]
MEGRELFEYIVKETREKCYAMVDFGIPGDQLKKAADAFIGFLDIPEHLLFDMFLWHPNVPHDSKNGEIGYVRRKKRKGHYDNKRLFHYSPLLEDKIAIQDGRADPFLRHAKQIYQESCITLNRILSALSFKYPAIRDKFYDDSIYPRFFLRFIAYDPETKGEYIATNHIDSGGITIAIAESTPGLRIGSKDGPKTMIEHHDGKAIFMPACTFPDATEGGFLPQAWHDVIQINSKPYSDGIARWAIVFFADLAMQETIPVTKTHSAPPPHY